MEDQAVQAAQAAHIWGAAIGSGIAAFVSSWMTLIRPLKKQVEEARAGPSEKIALLQAEQLRILERLSKAEGRVANAMTIEEFAAHAKDTTDSIRQMTEKIGILTGTVQGMNR